MAIVSLALGILAVLLFWAAALPLILGVAGIVLGVLGTRQAKAGAGSQGVATAGIVLGLIASVLAIILLTSTGGKI